MEIKTNKVVGIDYVLKDQHGEIVDSTQGKQPLVYLHGSGLLLPAMEDSLDGKKTGDTFDLVLSPTEGYGEYHEELKQIVDRESFQGAELEIGSQFLVAMDEDDDDAVVKVVAIEGDKITIDANHDLAGMTLNFEVTVTEVREATQEELDHGHAHGPGGHHHH